MGGMGPFGMNSMGLGNMFGMGMNGLTAALTHLCGIDCEPAGPATSCHDLTAN